MMNTHRGLALAAAAALALAAVADGAHAQRGRGGNRGGAASLPQVSCPGATASRSATDAQSALNRTVIPGLAQAVKEAAFQQALTTAEGGMAAEPQNPHLPYIAAQAHLGLGHADQAIAMYRKAAELCPELGGPEVVNTLFDTGMERFQGGDTTGAIGLWEGVAALDSTRMDAVFNLGVLYAQRGDVPRSLVYYRRVAANPGADSAAAERKMIALGGILGAGAQLFQQDKFQEAGELFTFVHNADPNHRDAWYNHALSLYKLERWQELIPVATRLMQMDPLNYNAQIILFNAYKALSETAKAQNNTAVETQNRNLALRTLETADALPVQVDGVQFNAGEGNVRVSGIVTGGTAAAGSPIQLEFTLTNPSGEVGKGTVTVAAPAKEQKANFELTVPVTATATSYRYRLVR